MTNSNSGATSVVPRAYPKRVSDLLPGHVVLGKDGKRLRVVMSKRVRRNVHEVMFRDEDGLSPRPKEYVGHHEVLVLDGDA